MSTYTKGQSVMYNSKCCTIYRTPGKRLTGVTITGYLVKENKTNTVHDNVPEAQLTACNSTMVCNDCWSDFVYTGDNGAASQWIVNNIVKYVNGGTNLQWGPNADNTQYIFNMNGNTWTKNVTTPSN